MRFCGHCGAPFAASTEADQSAEPSVTDALRSFVAGPVADRLVEAGGHLPEERRLITALFADVSGFTSLAERLDPEQLLEVIDPVISGLSSIVGRYEGYVEKFAGDALLALFGAPVAHDDDAARALLVALEMHEELERMCAELPHNPELTVHIGVNSGHGIARILGSEARMDYAVLGDSVILAQRLESAAPAGETYVSKMTMRLTEEAFEFEPVGELSLKGKSEPVPAWRLIGKLAGARRIRSTPLVGRERELAELDAVLQTVANGRGSVVTVTGEPGVGKSRLTEAAQARAEEFGISWLQTRCLSYGVGLAYWPYADLIRHEPVATTVPYFSRLLGMPGGEEVAGLEPEAFRRGLHSAFADWLGVVTGDRPTVLAIEDLHWADASSLALTRELIESMRGQPLAFYLIARPEAAPQLAEITADTQSRAIELGALDATAVASVIDAMLAGSAPRGLVPFVTQRTSGNPFFVQELVRALQDHGTLVLEDGTWKMRAGWDARQLPPTIEEVLAARIDLLPRAAVTTLGTAAVIGRRIAVPLLHTVATEVADLETSVAQLVGARFLDRVEQNGLPQLAFHHALVQDVAYGQLLRRRRTELHRRVAEAAEAMYGAGDETIDLLARHLYLGDAGEKAVDYLVRAGERAKGLFANEEAILHFTRAAELAPADMRLTLELADLHELVGNYDEALRLYTDVRDKTQELPAWSGMASVLRKRGEYEAALSVVDEAFACEALRNVDLAPLWLEQAWTLSVAGRFEQAIDVLEAGLVTVGHRSDAVVARMLLQLARAETVEGHLDEALENGLKAHAMFEQAGDVRGLATAHRLLGDTYCQRGQLDEAAETLQRGIEFAERVGSAEEIGACVGNLAFVELQRGNYEDAVACNLRALDEFERTGHAAGRAQVYANLAWTLSKTGDFEDALAYCDKALEIARSIGHPLIVADVHDTIAWVKLGQEDIVSAGEWAERAANLYLEVGAAPRAAGSFELAADAWERAGEEERARANRARARELTAEAA
jgi:adenylate cyclase